MKYQSFPLLFEAFLTFKAKRSVKNNIRQVISGSSMAGDAFHLKQNWDNCRYISFQKGKMVYLHSGSSVVGVQ